MTTIGLIDCNAFYCACQRAFDPDIKRRPVVVLSNNDGCAIARTTEAKHLGIRMGEPWHKIKDQKHLHTVRWYSSNYPLYSDMSRRVFQTLYNYVPRVEPYSIDEMFLDLTNLPSRLTELCRSIRHDVQQVTKIPTCIGWGKTKTIAKFANHIAKSRPELAGLCDLTHEEKRKHFYQHIDINEIWGLGRRLVPRFYRHGIRTIEQFTQAEPTLVRQVMGISGLRLQRELNGFPALTVSEFTEQRKGIVCSRSFGRPLTKFEDLREALTTYCYKACEKLRAEKLDTAYLTVFLTTNRFYRKKFYANQISMTCTATNDSLRISHYASQLLKKIYKPNYRYVKTGIALNDLAPVKKQQRSFHFLKPKKASNENLLQAMDHLNTRFGQQTLFPLSAGLQPAWKPRAAFLSQRYTTHINELMQVHTW